MNYIITQRMRKQASSKNLRASLGQGRGLGPGKGRIDGTGLAYGYPSDLGSTDSTNVAASTFASAAISGALGGGVALLFNAMGGNFSVPASALGSAALGGGMGLITALNDNRSKKTEANNAYLSDEDLEYEIAALEARTPNLRRKGIRV